MNIDRIRLIRKLQQNMLSFIYQQQERLISEKMVQYANENQALLNSDTNTFIYDGVWYSAGDPIRLDRYYLNKDYRPNRELHPDIRYKVAKLFQNAFEAQLQQGILQIYLGDVLITAKTVDDLYKLLPYPLHPAIDRIDPLIYNEGSSELTEQMIEQFKEDNAEAIQCLNKMLLLRLICS